MTLLLLQRNNFSTLIFDFAYHQRVRLTLHLDSFSRLGEPVSLTFSLLQMNFICLFSWCLNVVVSAQKVSVKVMESEHASKTAAGVKVEKKWLLLVYLFCLLFEHIFFVCVKLLLAIVIAGCALHITQKARNVPFLLMS